MSIYNPYLHIGKILPLLQAHFLLFVYVVTRWARCFGGRVWWKLVSEPRERPAELPSWCQPARLSVSVETVSTKSVYLEPTRKHYESGFSWCIILASVFPATFAISEARIFTFFPHKWNNKQYNNCCLPCFLPLWLNFLPLTRRHLYLCYDCLPAHTTGLLLLTVLNRLCSVSVTQQFTYTVR